MTRASSLGPPDEATDPEYVEGLRASVGTALDYALATIDGTEEELGPPLPPALQAQAQLAARYGVSLDTVLRRYFAGYTLVTDFLVEEAASVDGLPGEALKPLLRRLATQFDRLVVSVTEDYRRAAEQRSVGAERQRAERVRRLLDGELVDTAAIPYDFDSHHLGLIASGPGVQSAVRDVADAFDRRSLLIQHEEGVVWAWLGGRRELDPRTVEESLASRLQGQARFALGEPACSLSGWRRTYRQAAAAMAVGRGAPGVVRYANVALLGAVVSDDLLGESLRELFLDPLGETEGEARVHRETLRAYFAAGHNVSSAAADIGVNRNTVANRLRAIEDRLDRPLTTCSAELEIALRLDSLDRPGSRVADAMQIA